MSFSYSHRLKSLFSFPRSSQIPSHQQSPHYLSMTIRSSNVETEANISSAYCLKSKRKTSHHFVSGIYQVSERPIVDLYRSTGNDF
jgi:hypothetical protein